MRKDQFKEKFTANVWAGIVRNRTIEPIFFQGRSNKQQYLGFLQNKIEGFLSQFCEGYASRKMWLHPITLDK
jgi:hypothetical protein